MWVLHQNMCFQMGGEKSEEVYIKKEKSTPNDEKSSLKRIVCMIKEMTFDAEYASEVMDEIPAGYINKTICGCGLTTVALENNVDTVIAVPTIYLAQNKASQYPNERYPGKVLAVTGETTPSDIEWYRWNNRTLKIISQSLTTFQSVEN